MILFLLPSSRKKSLWEFEVGFRGEVSRHALIGLKMPDLMMRFPQRNVDTSAASPPDYLQMLTVHMKGFSFILEIFPVRKERKHPLE